MKKVSLLKTQTPLPLLETFPLAYQTRLAGIACSKSLSFSLYLATWGRALFSVVPTPQESLGDATTLSTRSLRRDRPFDHVAYFRVHAAWTAWIQGALYRRTQAHPLQVQGKFFAYQPLQHQVILYVHEFQRLLQVKPFFFFRLVRNFKKKKGFPGRRGLRPSRATAHWMHALFHRSTQAPTLCLQVTRARTLFARTPSWVHLYARAKDRGLYAHARTWKAAAYRLRTFSRPLREVVRYQTRDQVLRGLEGAYGFRLLPTGSLHQTLFFNLLLLQDEPKSD